MKRFSLRTVLIVVTFVAISFATIAFFMRERAALMESLAFERTRIKQLQGEIRSQEKILFDQKKQMTSRQYGDNQAKMLLVRLLRDPDFSASADFLSGITSDALFVKMIQWPDSPNIALFRFADPKISNTIQGTIQKKMHVIVTLRPLRIVDVISSEIKFEGPETDANPWKIEYQLPNGSTIRYRVLPTGFEKMKSGSE